MTLSLREGVGPAERETAGCARRARAQLDKRTSHTPHERAHETRHTSQRADVQGPLSALAASRSHTDLHTYSSEPTHKPNCTASGASLDLHRSMHADSRQETACRLLMRLVAAVCLYQCIASGGGAPGACAPFWGGRGASPPCWWWTCGAMAAPAAASDDKEREARKGATGDRAHSTRWARPLAALSLPGISATQLSSTLHGV